MGKHILIDQVKPPMNFSKQISVDPRVHNLVLLPRKTDFTKHDIPTTKKYDVVEIALWFTGNSHACFLMITITHLHNTPIWLTRFAVFLPVSRSILCAFPKISQFFTFRHFPLCKELGEHLNRTGKSCRLHLESWILPYWPPEGSITIHPEN